LFDDFKEKVNNYTLENKERYAKQNKKVQKEISINIDCFYCEEDLWVEF
jgi:Skp family chaperone for outer membrane proteins